jgi:hypothetical protein
MIDDERVDHAPEPRWLALDANASTNCRKREIFAVAV